MLDEGRGDKIFAGPRRGGTRNSWQCALPDARPLTNAIPMKPLLFLLATLVFTSSTSDCTVNDSSDGSEGTCTNNLDCHTASTFQSLVASYLTNESILPLLRGTVDNVVSKSDIDALVASLPANAFVEAGGYSDNYPGKDTRGYSALGLKELSVTSSPSEIERYQKLLQIREAVRLATEQSLNLCPGTLFIDYTTISQKGDGGLHSPHADNCHHFFRETSWSDGRASMATCDTTRSHPYPSRVAASILYLNDKSSGNFEGGQFFFANSSNYGEVEDEGRVPVESGRMIYFTSGVENLHGAFPVLRRDEGDAQPRRLALAMWYVVNPELDEYVPSQTFVEASTASSTPQSKTRQRAVYHTNDPEAPKGLFDIPLPNNVDVDTLIQSMGTYLVSQQNTPQLNSWKVSKYGEYKLHILFQDHSAMFSLDFGVAMMDTYDWGVVFERHTDGKKPASLQYQLQESVILHGVLDELSRLVLKSGHDEDEESFNIGLEKARETLPARRA